MIINDKEMLETIIEDIENNYDKTAEEAAEIADRIKEYLVDQMWETYTNSLDAEMRYEK